MKLPTNVDRLRKVLEARVRRGEFTLSSGQTSDWYLDVREVVLSDPLLVGNAVYDALSLQHRRKGRTLFGGVLLGGVPIAVAVAMLTGERSLVVREPKGHGLNKVVEGGDGMIGSLPLVLIDDVFTTGGSLGKAGDLLFEHHHVRPALYMTILNRNKELQGIDTFLGQPFVSLYGLEDIGIRT